MITIKTIEIIILLLILLLLLVSNNKNESFSNNTNNSVLTAYVINLDKSKDRLNLITKQCARENIKMQRFPAVDGRTLDITSIDIIENKKMDKGAIGCSLSHINLWKSVRNNRDKMFIVFEDDCLIGTNFNQNLNAIIKEAPRGWDIIYLGGSNLKGKKISKNLMVPVKVNKKSTHNTGTYAMLINSKCLDTLIKNNTPLRENIDQNLKNNLYEKLKVFFVVPPLVKHNNELDSMRRLNSGKSATTRWFSKVQDNITLL